MQERAVQRKITKIEQILQVEDLLVVKITCDSMIGWPDLQIHGSPAKLLFLEVKRPTASDKKKIEAEEHQKLVHKYLQNLGFKVLVVDTVDEAIAAVKQYFNLKATTTARLKRRRSLKTLTENVNATKKRTAVPRTNRRQSKVKNDR